MKSPQLKTSHSETKPFTTKTKSTLADIQIQLRALVKGSRPNSNNSIQAYDLITEDAGFTKKSRMRIYSNAWFFRISESIKEDYSALAKCLGDDVFLRLIRGYLKAYPSHSYTLAHAGDQLPDYLKQWKSPHKKLWHLDLALLERSYYQTYFAKDPQPWDLSSLAKLTHEDAENLKLALEAPTYLLESSWAIDTVWKGLRSTPLFSKRYYLVYRQGFDVQVTKLRPRTFRILKEIEAQSNLGQLIGKFPMESTVALISSWAQSGVIKPLSVRVRS